MNTLIALIKREILEHRNLLRVPMILVGIAVLVKVSLTIGNLSLDLNMPDALELDATLDSALDGVVAKALNSMNYVVMMVMFVVAAFYALASLFNERQDDSVLFWRSLPISDGMTVGSKLLVAVVGVPIVIVLCQGVLAVVFFGTDSIHYLSNYYSHSLLGLGKVILWSLLPTIAWCLLCSEIAKKNPFLLAFVAPILFILVDYLFLNGYVSDIFIINRVTGVDHYETLPLVLGIVFSVVCLVLAISKRSQRF